MTGFLIIVGPLRWPMSDLKAIKHKTFCKTRMPLWSGGPAMPLWEIMIITQWRLEWPGRSEGAGVNGERFTGVLCAGRGQGGLLGLATPPPPPTPPRHKLFPSCRLPVAARYAAEPLCLVAAGDKAVADGRVVVLAPWQWRGQLRSLSWPAEENA